MACIESICEGCFYEGQATEANRELEDLRGELERMRHVLASAKAELEGVKRAYCLVRKDLLQEQEENSRLKRELEQMERQAPAAGQEAVRPYMDFMARLRRTMQTAPDLLAQEG